MRSVRLAGIAMEAEGVRLRGFVIRVITRAVLGLVALVFFFAAVVFAHLAAWDWLRTSAEETSVVTAGILGGSDLLIAVILGVLAKRSSPSSVEVEALHVRRTAVRGIGGELSLARLTIPILTAIVNAWRRPSG